MRKVWKCDYCHETFLAEAEAEEHEKTCGRNPSNKISDRTIFRLAMLCYEINDIAAASILLAGVQDVDRLIQEAERADRVNCPFTVYEKKHQIAYILRRARDIGRKREGLKTTRVEDIEKYYPEMYEAIAKTLQRRAWNE